MACAKLTGQIDYTQELSFSETSYQLQDLIQVVTSVTQVNFSYSSSVVNPEEIIVLRSRDYNLEGFLAEITTQLNIDYIEFRGKILLVERKKEWQPFQIYGFVRDEASGEALIGASIYNFTDKSGTQTNDFGFFTLKINTPEPYVKISFIGYESLLLDNLSASRSESKFFLKPIFTIPEILVTPEDSINQKLVIQEAIDKTAKNISPGLFGQKDILQALKFLPGLQSGSEVQGNLLVRGGGSDQNLILMDGVPLYEVNHLLGLTSIFNEDAVNDVDIFTSGFSPKYGGRLSSIINIQIKDGNKFVHRTNASIGLLGAKVHADGPLVNGRTSYNVSLRTSFINTLVAPLARRLLDVEQSDFGYSDMNLKFHHKFTENSSLSISTYQGIDKVGFATTTFNEEFPEIAALRADNSIDWRNNIISMRYSHLLSKNLFVSFSANTVNYSLNSRSSNFYNIVQGPDSIVTEELDVFANSLISDRNLRLDIEYNFNNKHEVMFGAGLSNHIYNPSVISKEEVVSSFMPNQSVDLSATEQFVYFEDKLDLSKYISFSGGFHFSHFEIEDVDFSSFQPRLKLSFYFDEKTDLEISYSKMTQFVHLLVNPGTGLPSDLWLPSTSLIPPEHAEQFSTRLNYIWNKDCISFVSAYYKRFENLIEYRSAFPLYNPVINQSTVLPIFNNSRDWEDRVEIGEGSAYGVDFFTAYTTKRWNTSLSYNYGISERQFDNINKGEPFPFKYDRRHDVSISGNYKVNDRTRIGANWVYGTGHATTFATRAFRGVDGELILDFSSRNNFRLPAYHRLDFSFNYLKPLSDLVDLEITAGLYNAYNRLNPYYVYLYSDQDGEVFTPRQVGIFPVLPFFNLRLNM